jgi:hypothetical protein
MAQRSEKTVLFLCTGIRQRGEQFRFLQTADNEFAVQSWTAGSVQND